MPDYHLSVTEPFGDYARGDRITDAVKVTAVLETHPHHVVRVVAPVVEAGPVRVDLVAEPVAEPGA